MNVNTYGISLWMEWSERMRVRGRRREREWIATWLPYIQFNTSAHFHSPSSLSFYFLVLFFLDRNSRYDFFLLSFACIGGIALRQRNDEACILAFVIYRDSLIELIEEYDIDFVPHAPCTMHKPILFHSPMVAVPRILFVYTFTTYMCANLSMADCGCCLAECRSSFSRTTNKRRR